MIVVVGLFGVFAGACLCSVAALGERHWPVAAVFATVAAVFGTLGAAAWSAA